MTDENMLALTAQSTRRSDTQGAAESRLNRTGNVGGCFRHQVLVKRA